MKGLAIAILLLSAIHQKAASQVNEEDLIGTWFPVMELDQKGDTSFSISTPNLLVFEPNGKGMAEFPGETTREYPFSYEFFADSIFAKTLYTSFFFEAYKSGKDKLTLVIDKERIIKFIRLPGYNTQKSLSELKKTVSGSVWEFTLPDYDKKEDLLVKYEFSHLTDSSRSHLSLWNRAYSSVRPYSDMKIDTDLWSVSQHRKTFILHIDLGWDLDRYQTLIIRNFDKNTLEVDFWREGIKYELSAKKLTPPKAWQIDDSIEKLTRTKWRFESEKVPDQIDSLNLRNFNWEHDYYEELPPYNNDSTLLIKQSDLDQKLLVLEFKDDKTYKIYREERVLDQGRWRFIFNYERLILQSSRDSGLSDGIFGGYIFLDKIKRKTLKISRDFLNNQSRSYWNEFSHLETYKPYRKRH